MIADLYRRKLYVLCLRMLVFPMVGLHSPKIHRLEIRLVVHWKLTLEMSVNTRLSLYSLWLVMD